MKIAQHQAASCYAKGPALMNAEQIRQQTKIAPMQDTVAHFQAWGDWSVEFPSMEIQAKNAPSSSQRCSTVEGRLNLIQGNCVRYPSAWALDGPCAHGNARGKTFAILSGNLFASECVWTSKTRKTFWPSWSWLSSSEFRSGCFTHGPTTSSNRIAT